MSRERTDTASSSNSFGLRERSHTGGSMDMLLETTTQGVNPSPQRGSFSIATGSSPAKVAPTTTTTRHTSLRYWVDWLQKQPVPGFLLPTLKRLLGSKYNNNSAVGGNNNNSSTSRRSSSSNKNSLSGSMTAGGSNNESHHDDDVRMVYCIRGLDRVVFGTTAAADCVVLMGIQPPRYLWYMVSGAFCDIFQLAVDITLHMTLFPNDAALCWMLSFVISIVARHTSHRYLVFGDYVPNYWQSLGRMYAGYSFSIVVSTIFNYLITSGVAQVPHYVAYVCTLLWTGLANYFILKRLWKMGGGSPPPGIPQPSPNTRASSSSGGPGAP